MPKIYEIKTHHKRPREAAESWRLDGICAVGYRWTYEEEYPDGLPNDQWGLFPKMRKGDIVLAYARPCMVAYVGEVADHKINYQKHNLTGRRHGYWNQRAVTWWPEPNHFDPKDLPHWLHRQLGTRGTTIKEINLGNHTFSQAKAIIRTKPTSGSAFASQSEDTVKAGIRNYFLSNAHVFEPGLRIRKDRRKLHAATDRISRRKTPKARPSSSSVRDTLGLRLATSSPGTPGNTLAASNVPGSCWPPSVSKRRVGKRREKPE